MFEASKKFLREMVAKLRLALGVQIIDATELTTQLQYKELTRVIEERREVTKAMRKLHASSPSARYDLEYSTAQELSTITGVKCQFKGTHYWFWSPVLSCGFALPIGFHGRSKIVEIGCGSGELLQAMISENSSINAPNPCWEGAPKNKFGGDDILAIDTSPVAIKRVNEKVPNLPVLCGRIQDAGLAPNSRDSVILSYFVDRDSNQQGTFKESSRILGEGGTLVLEGLFPCILSDSSGVSYGTANVTRGLDAVEDIQLVVAEFARLGVALEKIVVGQRLVYSMDGPEVLPSYILIFQKDVVDDDSDDFIGSH